MDKEWVPDLVKAWWNLKDVLFWKEGRKWKWLDFLLKSMWPDTEWSMEQKWSRNLGLGTPKLHMVFDHVISWRSANNGNCFVPLACLVLTSVLSWSFLSRVIQWGVNTSWWAVEVGNGFSAYFTHHLKERRRETWLANLAMMLTIHFLIYIRKYHETQKVQIADPRSAATIEKMSEWAVAPPTGMYYDYRGFSQFSFNHEIITSHSSRD